MPTLPMTIGPDDKPDPRMLDRAAMHTGSCSNVKWQNLKRNWTSPRSA